MAKTISTKLVIEGEQEYKNSIKNVNASLRELQAELKSSDAQFKGNENSMEALSSKADILSRMYEEQSEKVETLRSALEEAQNEHQNFADKNDELSDKLENAKDRLEELRASSEDTTDEEQRLQDEIENLNSQLDQNDEAMQKAANAVTNWQTQLNNAQADLFNTQNSLNEVNTKMGETSEKGEASSTALGAVTGSLGSMGTAGSLAGSAIQGLVSGGMMGLVSMAPQVLAAVWEIIQTFSEANGIIAQATGATGDALKELNDIAYDTWLAVDEADLTTVATAVGEINTRLDATGEELSYLTEQFEIYADVTGSDVQGAVANVSQVMYRWNLENEDSAFLLDKLVLAGQKTGISVDELSSSLVSNASTLQTMGYTLDESIALLSNFEKYGIQSSNVLMGLRKAAKEFTDEGKDAKDGIEDLIDRIANASSETEQLLIAYDYFNTRSAPEFVTAVNEGRLEVDDFVEALEECRGVMELTDATSDTFEEKWAAFWKDQLATIEYVAEVIGALVSGEFEAIEGIVAEYTETMGYAGSHVTAFVDLSTVEYDRWAEKANTTVEGVRSELAVLCEQYTNTYNTAYAGINAEIELFNELDNSSMTSVDSMISALDSQLKYMDEYADNMKKAVELGVDEGLIQKLADGSEESAAILRGIVADGDENVDELNEKLARVEEGKEAFASQVAEAATDFSEQAQKIVDDSYEMVGELNMEAEAFDAGAETMHGLIEGLNSVKEEVGDKYAEIAKYGNYRFREESDINSPSRVFKENGQFIVAGLIEGISSEENKAVKAYEDLATATLGGYSAMVDQLYASSLTTPSISNYSDSGYNDSRSFVMNVSVASASESDMQEVYKYISTNFAMAQGGRV